MVRHKLFSLWMLALCLALTAPGKALAQTYTDQVWMEINTLMQANDYEGIAGKGKEFWAKIDDGSVQPMGPSYANIAFYVGYANFMLRKNGKAFSPEDYQKWCIHPMEEHLKQRQDDPVKKLSFLNAAYQELYKLQEVKDAETENHMVWNAWHYVIKQHEMNGFKKPVSEEIAKAIYGYIQVCMDVAENTSFPDIFRYRIRHACQLGFGQSEKMDRFFWQYYEMTFFDDGNVKAGVFLQRALDLRAKNLETNYPDCVKYLKKAIDITKSKKYKAELYRTLAELTVLLDKEDLRMTATDYARQAYALYPYSKDIRDLYGSSLYALAFSMEQKNNYAGALKYYEDAIQFEWEGDEYGYLGLALAESAHGMKYKAIKHALDAYKKACMRHSGEDLESFAKGYKNILKQWGEEDKFRPCQK